MTEFERKKARLENWIHHLNPHGEEPDAIQEILTMLIDLIEHVKKESS